MDNKERVQEIDRQIALLRAEKAQLNGANVSLCDLKDYFAKKAGEESINACGTYLICGKRHEAWDCLRRLAICGVCGGETRKYVKNLTMDEWQKTRELLKKMIDFYVENAENP